MDCFRQQINKVSNRLHNKTITLPDEMRLNFTSQQSDTIKLSYFSEQGQSIKFSKRESEMIRLFSKGKTNKKIACELNLSPRTIESYLENIKIKTNCYTKGELIEKIMQMY